MRILLMKTFDPIHQEEFLSLLEVLCRIPAPSGQEELRASFIQNWLSQECGLTAVIDKVQNVLVPINHSDAKNFTLLMAHTDTVFPDTVPMPVVRTDTHIASPGVGDDTACVAMLMLLLKYRQQEFFRSENNFLFAFNSCEEGLGNLKGCRQILSDYAGRIARVISFDGGVAGICSHAVGSLRYQISLYTKGGHSYNDFGSANAIHTMSCLINELYQLKVPATGRNTYNVGTIDGGTSVNTIAQSCSCLFEYRSDIRENLASMDAFFHRTLDAFSQSHPQVTIKRTLVGERPCGGDVDPDAQQALTALALDSIVRISGFTPIIGSGSTDCNIPLSLGIPAICFGGLMGDGVHTREEYVTISSLIQEARIIEDFLEKLIEDRDSFFH